LAFGPLNLFIKIKKKSKKKFNLIIFRGFRLKKTHQRENRTPVKLTTPGFEVLTEHQASSPMQSFTRLITYLTIKKRKSLINELKN